MKSKKILIILLSIILAFLIVAYLVLGTINAAQNLKKNQHPKESPETKRKEELIEYQEDNYIKPAEDLIKVHNNRIDQITSNIEEKKINAAKAVNEWQDYTNARQ